jgi:hypothetical protein
MQIFRRDTENDTWRFVSFVNSLNMGEKNKDGNMRRLCGQYTTEAFRTSISADGEKMIFCAKLNTDWGKPFVYLAKLEESPFIKSCLKHPGADCSLVMQNMW